MKPFITGEHLTLTDADGTVLGTADIDAVDGPLLLGTFRSGPEFDRVADLFSRFEEHVEASALAVLPAIERQIAALGLRVSRQGEPDACVRDVQIYSNGGFSCRPIVPAELNGRQGETSTATPA